MIQVRVHGRGGQGVVTAAELLSVAAFLDGHRAQAFPTFGSERMGAPVAAYCRIAETPIRSHEPVAEPDAVVVQDPTLLHELDVFAGLAAGGLVLVNSARTPDELGIDALAARPGGARLRSVPATAIALRRTGRPVPNTALLGALAALTGAVTPAALAAAIRRRFPGPAAEANVAAAGEAAGLVAPAGAGVGGA